MLKSSLCNCNDAYIFVKIIITITVAGADTAARQADVKSWAPFNEIISEINDTKVDNTRDLNVVMPMHNLVEYSNNYTKKHQEVYASTTKVLQMIT